MKAAIMQPYFMPYVGYFQLINAVDVFIVYDNIQYTKKGWVNRNRILQNGSEHLFSLPLKKDSDYLDVVQRNISPSFNRLKLLNQIRGAYHKAPYFEQTYPLLEKIVNYEDENLFEYIFYSLKCVCKHLRIDTEIKISSKITINHELKSQDKVIALCEAVGANCYINPIGGTTLYSKNEFESQNISLSFLKSNNLEYQQFDSNFVPWLSIIDVMMFNSIDTIRDYLSHNYELI